MPDQPFSDAPKQPVEEHAVLATSKTAGEDDTSMRAQLKAALAQLTASDALARARQAEIDRLMAEIDRLQEKPESTPKATDRSAPPMPVSVPASSMPAITLRGRTRRFAALAYRLVRPVARPLAWRTRSFLTAELVREIADMRAKQDLLLNREGGGIGGVGFDPGLAPALERLLLSLALEHADEPPDKRGPPE